MDGKTALGASSPAKPALHMPEPLSTTRAATSSSAILSVFNVQVFELKTICPALRIQEKCLYSFKIPQLLYFTMGQKPRRHTIMQGRFGLTNYRMRSYLS